MFEVTLLQKATIVLAWNQIPIPQKPGKKKLQNEKSKSKLAKRTQKLKKNAPINSEESWAKMLLEQQSGRASRLKGG